MSYHKNKTTRHWQTAKHLVSFQLAINNLTHTYRVRLGVSLQKRGEEEVQAQPADGCAVVRGGEKVLQAALRRGVRSGRIQRHFCGGRQQSAAGEVPGGIRGQRGEDKVSFAVLKTCEFFSTRLSFCAVCCKLNVIK